MGLKSGGGLVKKWFIPAFLVILHFSFLLGAAFASQAPEGIVPAEVRHPEIVFSDGERNYSCALEELGLSKLGGESKDLVHGQQIYCFDHELLSYRLYQLSLEVNRPVKDPFINLEEDGDIIIIPGQTGREVDLGLLIRHLGNPGPFQEVYSLPLKIIQPAVAENELAEKIPRIKWASYATILADIPDRTENIRVASQKLQGLTIPPGGEVSFNEIVGPRVKEQGFREAKVIVGGGFEPGLGGGVCQVSSTLYNAVLLAGLEVKERYNHSVRIAYVPLGQDATVVFNAKDLKFVNNTGSYLMIRSKLTGLRLEISIYGNEPPVYDQIRISTKVIKSIAIPEKYIINPQLAPLQKKVVDKGQPGYMSQTYRTFIQGDITWTELLSRDYYAPISKVIAAGQG